MHTPHRVAWPILAGLALTIPVASLAQQRAGGGGPGKSSAPISAAAARERLVAYAHDSMGGRLAGTEGGVRATAYIARELARIGLRPAGDGGTYFQDVPLVERRFDSTSTASLAGTLLTPWTDYVPRDQGPTARPFGGVATLFAGTWGDAAMVGSDQGAGKVVVIAPPIGPGGRRVYSVPRLDALARYSTARAVCIANLDLVPPQLAAFFRNGTTGLREHAAVGDSVPSYCHVSPDVVRRMFGAPLESVRPGATGAAMSGEMRMVERALPARNVVAVLPGSDPALRGQYVAIGAHSDHVGTLESPVDHDSVRAFNREAERLRAASASGQLSPAQLASIRVNVDSLRRVRPARADSIFNGADDDGSGTVAVIEIAEALAVRPPKRSVLFVWHTAEELGLFGARHFTDHPTVPRDSIVAQLNMDMVGRGSAGDLPGGGPGYVQLIGSRRLSTELGDLVEAVNGKQRAPFTFDYQYDAAGHPENYYCRSDHYMYARYGIPVVFFSTGDHVDYHRVTDEVQYIDFDHLARVAQLVHDVARQVSDLDHRVQVDKPKPDPRGNCQQ